MIKSLHIKNYALIESLDIQLPPGLTIITGETGAGKSILLGALGLIMGDRADTKALYDDRQKCVIEGRFSIDDYDLESFFHENDLDYEQELIIRREITPSGKSRAFVNDTPTNLKVLQRLSDTLVDLHQQFDSLDIHQMGFQLRLLDALADNAKLLAQYQKGYRDYQQKRQRLRRLQEQNAGALRETEFLEFQLQEFTEADLVEGEQAAMEAELESLTHAEDTKRVTAEAFRFLSESEQSLVSQLQALGQSLQTASKVDQQVAAVYQRLQSSLAEMEDIGNELEKLSDALEHDPERIQALQDRLDLIYRLENKHQVTTVEALLAIQAQLEEQLSGFQNMDQEIKALEEEIEQQEKKLWAQALQLRERREKIAPGFAKKVAKRLADLAMPAAQLIIDFQEMAALTSTGLDEIQFLFSANKGSAPKPIKQVASGGELSRLTLVTKSLVARAMALPTLIFDEIDSGVSGDVALKMGYILRDLSSHHQVIVITHSPQIAARANEHLFVYKKEKANRTTTRLRALNQEERIRAIATMLSQNPPSDSALENAKELIAG